MSRRIISIAILLTAVITHTAMAAKVSGKVSAVSASNITATLTDAGLAKVGNQASIALWIEGVGAIPIKGNWQVKSISGSRITLIPMAEDNAQPLVGQDVTITDTNHVTAIIDRNQRPSRNTNKPSTTSREDIRYIQKRLAALGYNPGSADGAMGPKTRRAIRAYQTDKGLSVNGRTSESLRRSLADSGKKKITLLGREAKSSSPGLYSIDNRPSEEILDEARDYYFGHDGKPVDYEKSLELNRIVAERGHPDALYSIGVAYAFGKAVTKDLNRARDYFEQAAEKGSSRGAFNLATIHYMGMGVKKNHNLAMAYMRQAVAGGDPETYHGIGNFYRLGVGVEANREKAIEWYRKGATQGDEKCRKQLDKLGIKW